MSEFTVRTSCGTSNTFDTRSEAEDGKHTHASLCEECSMGEITIETPDGGSDVEVSGGVEVEDASDSAPAQAATGLPDNQPGVDTDPLDWVPGDFVDTIDGTQVINRKGYDVIAHHYGISVTTSVLVSPSESGFEYAEVRAVAETSDGVEYTAHGSAHVDRGDDSYLLLEMADTRAAKRATARATGVGMVAVEELQNDL